MPSAPPVLRVTEVDFHLVPTETRFPFQYGIASMITVPHLFVRVTLDVNGRTSTGLASEGLPPKWFTKNPGTTFEEDLPEMLGVIRHAAQVLQEEGLEGTFFHLWQSLYGQQRAWATEEGIAPLLANLGVSLMERAVLDGLCRGLERTCREVVHTNALGIDLGAVYPELEGRVPAEGLPSQPLPRLVVRHTVGLGDPLTPAEITENIGDGLPHALEECIAAYGINYFKIKLSGDLARDRTRLGELHRVIETASPGEYWFTLDGNEQFQDLPSFRDHWECYREEEHLRDFFEHLLFVEQPLHRDFALGEDLRESLRSWPGAPPLIIDESEAELGCLPKALDLGYRGTSHKNCKGIVKGIANASLLAWRRSRSPEQRFILSGEDLCNIGPVALLQDLAMMAMLGIPHVERNGHHYLAGLSMFPARVQSAMLEEHPDLYRRHENGFPTLKIAGGHLNLGSVLEAPFGTRPPIEVSDFERLEEWWAREQG